jgi:glyoxylase-like metal-dependent hydrolase (beta-lactamase superfamily II)
MKEHTRPRYEEIYPGIYRIILPLAGDKPGPVNAYLFAGRTVTLLDTGTLKSVHVLEHRLNQIGYTFSDIDQIILSHGHIDHYGAARKIVEGSTSPVTVIAHEEDKTLIEHGLEVPREQFLKYYRLMGVPLIFQVSLLLVRWIFLSMAENCRVDKFLSDGQKILMGDYEATVIETPGHTRGSISLYLEKEGILFPGDHILGHITPNAFVMLEADFDLPRRMSQVEFYDSLQKIEDIAPRIVYPAHGEPIHDVGSIITMFREQFNLRQNNIMTILAGGEYTVYQLGRKLFPDISGKRLPLEVFLMVSEVYTHLQVLQMEDRVDSYLNKGALYYRMNK